MSSNGITVADANTALGTIFTGTQWIQLHRGQPGAAGTANVATNSTRQSLTWNTAAGGVTTNVGQILWASVPATETYAYYSVWSASTAGTFHGSGQIANGSVLINQDFPIPAGALSMAITVAS